VVSWPGRMVPCVQRSLEAAADGDLVGDVDLTVTNARLWTRPDAEVRPGCFVSIRQGRVVELGAMSADQTHAPGVRILDVGGRVVTAGFWNCHVHLTEQVWSGAARAEPALLQGALDDMLVSHGFTNVVDLGSNSRNTLPLRSRIAAGELTGPTIWTATEPIHPPRGLPFLHQGVGALVLVVGPANTLDSDRGGIRGSAAAPPGRRGRQVIHRFIRQT